MMGMDDDDVEEEEGEEGEGMMMWMDAQTVDLREKGGEKKDHGEGRTQREAKGKMACSAAKMDEVGCVVAETRAMGLSTTR